jgi:transcriptional regulator with XRE-family HTH domain
MPPLTLDQRLTRMSQCRGMHVPYSAAMPAGRIDRDAWALAVQELIARFDPGPKGEGNKSAFARRVGVTTKTLERWAQRKTEVKIETVRSVVEALSLDPRESADLLTRIGFRFGVIAPPVPVEPEQDPVVRMILDDPQWTEAERAALLKRELQRIKREQADRIADYEWYLQQRRTERGTA